MAKSEKSSPPTGGGSNNTVSSRIWEADFQTRWDRCRIGESELDVDLLGPISVIFYFFDNVGGSRLILFVGHCIFVSSDMCRVPDQLL